MFKWLFIKYTEFNLIQHKISQHYQDTKYTVFKTSTLMIFFSLLYWIEVFPSFVFAKLYFLCFPLSLTNEDRTSLLKVNCIVIDIRVIELSEMTFAHPFFREIAMSYCEILDWNDRCKATRI